MRATVVINETILRFHEVDVPDDWKDADGNPNFSKVREALDDGRLQLDEPVRSMGAEEIVEVTQRVS